jgi:hypothetical protein
MINEQEGRVASKEYKKIQAALLFADLKYQVKRTGVCTYQMGTHSPIQHKTKT